MKIKQLNIYPLFFSLSLKKVPEYTRAMYIIILFVVFLLCNYIYE
jgi:prepilin signal peptidase PulO-like enzyme (type II secretory pathway)